MGYRKDYRRVPATLIERVRADESYCRYCMVILPNESDNGEVDHIIPDSCLPVDHVLTRDDLQLLCTSCHDRKTKRETTKARRAAELRAVHPRYR